MSYKTHEHQLASVMSMTSHERMWYFVDKVAESKALWGVRNDEGWLVPIAPEELEYFPVWPDPKFAQRATDEWFPGHRAELLALDDFLNESLPQLSDDNVKVAVFPNLDWTFWVVEAVDLAEYLREESSKTG